MALLKSYQKRFKTWYRSVIKTLGHLLTLIIRPFIDFYFNYGLSRASVMSYVLCANLIIFVYLLLAITISIDPFSSPSSLRRLLELHFLWPMEEKVLIKQSPVGFRHTVGDLVPYRDYHHALREYYRKHKINYQELIKKEAYSEIERVLKEQGKLDVKPFSITARLGMSIHEAMRNFSTARARQDYPLTISVFVILAIAYIALLLNIKTNLAESVSPLIWGNLPLANRSSEIMKILWRIPKAGTIKSRLYLFFMLPLLVAVAVSLLFTFHNLMDRLVDPYTPLNTMLTAIVSFVITGVLFTFLYELHVTGISKGYAAVGAFIASGLWLGGRLFFTTFGAVSLYRNLSNFAFVPIVLTWFYYFCAVFLFGIYVAHTLEYPNLTGTARSWGMRYIPWYHRYSTLSKWIRLDFLCRLAHSRYEEGHPPFIGINVKGDTADKIAAISHLPPTFVRECILEMVVRHPRIFSVDLDGTRQYCKLRLPPEEIDIMPVLTDPQETREVLNEMEEYDFVKCIVANYGTYWNVQPIMLSDVYHTYKAYHEKKRPSIADWKKEDQTEEIFF